MAETGTNEERVAIVTGGSRGIGRAVVEALLIEGFKVHFCGLARERVDQARRDLDRWSERLRGRAVDVGRQEQVDEFVAGVLDEDGRVDCLINNAGLGIFAPIDELSGEEWRRVIDTNLNGPFYFIRAVAPAMRERGEGFIFNIGSIASRDAFAGGAAYNASKFGLLGMTEAAILDLRADDVKVSAVMPGSVATGFARATDDDRWKLRPEDVARAVVDLLRYPTRALPSRIELRPTQTAKTHAARESKKT